MISLRRWSALHKILTGKDDLPSQSLTINQTNLGKVDALDAARKVAFLLAAARAQALPRPNSRRRACSHLKRSRDMAEADLICSASPIPITPDRADRRRPPAPNRSTLPASKPTPRLSATSAPANPSPIPSASAGLHAFVLPRENSDPEEFCRLLAETGPATLGNRIVEAEVGGRPAAWQLSIGTTQLPGRDATSPF